MQVPRSTPEVSAMKTITAFIGAAWLATPNAFKVMLLLMCFDLVSSLFSPYVRFRRRVTTLTLSCLLVCMVQLVWHAAHVDIGIDVVSGVCIFYGVGSAVDTLVNFAHAGVPLPPVLLSIMLRAQGLTGKEREELEALSRENDAQERKTV